MITIGLDLSMTSTGVTIYDTEKRTAQYYIVCNKITQKAQKELDKIDFIDTIVLQKITCDKNESSSVKEECKTYNIYNIVKQIERIVQNHKPVLAGIEGVSFGSTGSVADLAGLNYAVRIMLIDNGLSTIKIIPPSQNKKFATGNGSADKSVMLSAWKKIDNRVSHLPDYIKLDDVADSYFLSRICCL